MSEVADHPQVQARGCFAMLDGVLHPMPAPRFSRTPAAVPDSAVTATLLSEWSI
jgi:alpha-methylacyl-CoA racemase